MDEFSSILTGQTVTINLKAKYDKQVIAPTEYALEEEASGVIDISVDQLFRR